MTILKRKQCRVVCVNDADGHNARQCRTCSAPIIEALLSGAAVFSNT